MAWLSEFCRPFSQRSLRFVQHFYPDEPELLVAAVRLEESCWPARRAPAEPAVTLSLLKQAAQGGGGRAAWAAYVTELIEPLRYGRVGTEVVSSSSNEGADPENAEQVGVVERRLAESGAPPRQLSDEQAGPLLEALRRWQEADPENGFPLALEAWVLYGLHRDKQALARWQDAARLPVASGRYAEIAAGKSRLLHRMGLTDPEAAWAFWGTMFGLKRELGDCARMAYYEGRRAQMAGRAEQAVGLWNATADLGRHMQQSADFSLDFTLGVGLEEAGAAPVWRVQFEPLRGTPGKSRSSLGPGSQHAFYAHQVGEAATAQLRNRLGMALARRSLLTHYQAPTDLGERGARASYLLYLGGAMLGQLTLVFLLFALVSAWARREADDAAKLGPEWKLLIAAVAALPVTIAAVAAALLSNLFVPTPLLLGAYAFPVALALASSLLAARLLRKAGSSLFTVWRGCLRAVLPVVLALGLLAYLALGVIVAGLRADLAREVAEVNRGEMRYRVCQIGPAWEYSNMLFRDASANEAPPG